MTRYACSANEVAVDTTGIVSSIWSGLLCIYCSLLTSNCPPQLVVQTANLPSSAFPTGSFQIHIRRFIRIETGHREINLLPIVQPPRHVCTRRHSLTIHTTSPSYPPLCP